MFIEIELVRTHIRHHYITKTTRKQVRVWVMVATSLAASHLMLSEVVNTILVSPS